MSWVILSFALKKQAIWTWTKLYFSSCFWLIFTAFPLLCPRANRLVFFKERRERFALVTIYKRATVSEELSSLFWIAILLFSSQKTSYSLKNPKSELPTLLYWISLRSFYCFTTFFHLTNPSGPLNDVLKYFRIWS